MVQPSDVIELCNRADWRTVLVVLRNHGKSTEIRGLEPLQRIENLAKDLADLVKVQG